MSCNMKSKKYDYNITLVKSYGNTDLLRVVSLGALRRSGIVDDDDIRSPPCKNDVKLEASYSRARRMVFEYVMCNDFEYFFTLTINRDLHTADCLDSLHKSISLFFKKLNRSYNSSIKYVLVPELHSDGKNYHFHGVIMNIPPNLLYEFHIGDSQQFGRGILKQLKSGFRVFHFIPFSENFGFNSLSPIRDLNKTASYLCKYLTKNFCDNNIPVGSHLYYCSRGLNTANLLLKGTLVDNNIHVDFSNDYCSISNLSYSNDFDKIKECIK